jgi:hypothetical protein
VFGYLLLHQWAKLKLRVIVAKRGYYETPMLLTADGAFKLDQQALEEELDNADVRYIAPFILCLQVLCLSSEAGSCIALECMPCGSPLPLNNQGSFSKKCLPFTGTWWTELTRPELVRCWGVRSWS